jgi:hypothetical protein
MEIFNGDALLGKVYPEERSYSYDIQDEVLPTKIRLCQINDLYGKGQFLEAELSLPPTPLE